MAAVILSEPSITSPTMVSQGCNCPGCVYGAPAVVFTIDGATVIVATTCDSAPHNTGSIDIDLEEMRRGLSRPDIFGLPLPERDSHFPFEAWDDDFPPPPAVLQGVDVGMRWREYHRRR